jgi:hypothetical protein
MHADLGASDCSVNAACMMSDLMENIAGQISYGKLPTSYITTVVQRSVEVLMTISWIRSFGEARRKYRCFDRKSFSF